MKYCEIDPHSDNSLVSVVDEEDHVVAEKRLSVCAKCTTSMSPEVPVHGQFHQAQSAGKNSRCPCRVSVSGFILRCAGATKTSLF